RVFMLSPHGRMSPFQRRQMYTLQDENIFNIAVTGTFDDCQDVVKQVNADAAFKSRYHLGAVNSINWARIAAQVVYYFWGYYRVTESNEQKVDFSVPTGNFGDILAGYIAKEMELPVRRLILATNENNVLEEFFRTGTYRPRTGAEVATTSSPSMDISKASNFERYVFDLVGRDGARMRELWDALGKEGAFDVADSEDFARVGESDIVAGSSTHADRIRTIRDIFEKYGVLIDPHTADGVATGLRLRDKGVPLICLQTALPEKFSDTIREALGREPEASARYAKLADMPERFEVFPPDAEKLKEFISLHSD
ncbi:MAG: threonine synthase, partial [Patescibacteria group bacterium]|nr:threonine synthase [Patescibacteria group bacterium]